MAFGQFHGVGGRSGKPMIAMSDINVTPMVDVMLVLLIIFIIAAPLMNHAIKLDLPNAQSQVVSSNAQTITISFDEKGDLFWNEERIQFEQLEKQFSTTVKTNPQAEILLKADKATRYEMIAQVMAAAQEKGLSKIGFVTESKLEK
jgi:biopolymer transport protein ExbD